MAYLPGTDNIILIGMAGTGKTTLGRELSRQLSWAHVDTDYLLESWWGVTLQALHDWLGRDNFLLAEEQMLLRLNVHRCVISTGGSVVYREEGMRALKKTGTVIELYADMPTVRERVQNVHCRGLAINSGQTLEDLYNERRPLYAAYADHQVDTGILDPKQSIDSLLKWIRK